MVQILSHAHQLDTVGGYTKRLDGRLKSAARRDVVHPAFKPGRRLRSLRTIHAALTVIGAAFFVDTLLGTLYQQQRFIKQSQITS